MRRCFYHTDFYKMQYFTVALIQYSGPSKHVWTLSETVQKISKITYMAIRF